MFEVMDSVLQAVCVCVEHFVEELEYCREGQSESLLAEACISLAMCMLTMYSIKVSWNFRCGVSNYY